MGEDKILKCKECGQQFPFTTGEQDFYAEKGFQNEPVRCSACRRARKRDRSESGGARFRENKSFDRPSRGQGRFDKGQF